MSDQAAQASTATSDENECPICRMFKEGGCKAQFDEFMDCGSQAEKDGSGVQYDQCVKLFDAMRECMQKNPTVFGHLLNDVNSESSAAEQQASKK